MTVLELRYKKLHPDVIPLRRAHAAIGWDVPAFLISETDRIIQVVVPPRTTKIIPTGLVLLVPDGWYITVCSRSGLAAGTPPIFVANAPGIVDPDYTGELQILLYNGGYDSVYIKHGDYIAQLVLAPRPPEIAFVEFTETPVTRRGSSGGGSSDKTSST